MTSECAFQNSQAVAIAADSAVTVSTYPICIECGISNLTPSPYCPSKKNHNPDSIRKTGLINRSTIFTSAQKIYQLGNLPIGVMLYGRHQIFNIPFNVVYHDFCEFIKDDIPYFSLTEYADNFLTFLSVYKNRTVRLQAPFVGEKVSQRSKRIVRDELGMIFGEVKSDYIESEEENFEEYISSILNLTNCTLPPYKIDLEVSGGTFESNRGLLTGKWNIPRCFFRGFNENSVEKLAKRYDETLLNLISQHFSTIAGNKISLSNSCVDELKTLAISWLITTKYDIDKKKRIIGFDDLQDSLQSGIVFAGFGNNDLYPVVANIDFDDVYIGDNLRHLLAIGRIDTARPDPSNNRFGEDVDYQEAWAWTFAQSDVQKQLMYGIYPPLKEKILLKIYEDLIKKIETDTGELFDAIKNRIDDPTDKLEDILQYIVNNDLKNEFKNFIDSAKKHLVWQVKDRYKRYLDPESAEYFNLASEIRELSRKEHRKFANGLTDLDPTTLTKLAETMVSITSLLSNVRDNNYTVGGPIDVAVITKEGFRWVKSKN